MATAYGSTSFRAQRPVVPSGAGGKGLALTNTKKDMEGNLIGADTPDLGPIGTNNPATVTSGNRLDQPATPLGRSAQSPSRPMALNLRSPVQPPATAVETPGKSNVVTGPPAPIRGAMSGYQDSASPSMAPRPTDSPAWDKKPATPAALVNPSVGKSPASWRRTSKAAR